MIALPAHDGGDQASLQVDDPAGRVSVQTAAGTGPGAAGPGAARPQRYEWMDAGRGLAIVLVVLLHASDWLQSTAVPVAGWETLNDVVSGVRMPLFFTISGMLGARWVRARWPDLVSRKVAVLFWVYLLWQPIGLAAAAMADQITGDRQSGLHWVMALAATIVRPRSELWFLWALAVYFVLARLTARARLWIQLVAAGAVAALALCTQVSEGTLGWNGPPKFYVFFLLGAHCRTPLLTFAQRVRGSVGMLLALIVTWVGLASAAQALDADRFVGPGLLTRSLGLLAGIAVAGLLARGRLLRYLGSRTLPIYLAHTPLIIMMVYIVHAERGSSWIRALSPVLPLLLTVSAIPLSLLLHALLRATPARMLYAPPARVTALVHRVCSPRRRTSQETVLHPTRPPLPQPVPGPAPDSPVAATPRRRGPVEAAADLDLTWPTGASPQVSAPRADTLVGLGASRGASSPVGARQLQHNPWPAPGQAHPTHPARRPSPYPAGITLRPPYSLPGDTTCSDQAQRPAAPRPTPRRPRHRAED